MTGCENCSLNYKRNATGDIFSGVPLSAEAHMYFQMGQAVKSHCYLNCDVVRLERQGVRMLLAEGVFVDTVITIPRLPDLVRPLAS